VGCTSLVVAGVLLGAALTGCVSHGGRGTLPKPDPERYVPILEGLSVGQVRSAMDVLAGLKPEIAGGLSFQLVVPRSMAGEAYRRLLNSPIRDFPVLVQWD
jgi:hypothetical protein